MVKLIFMFKRKPGTTLQQFRDYYEQKHVPFVIELLPYFKSYRRNFIRHDKNYSPSGIGAKTDFDAVTELTFASQGDYDRMREALADPAILGQIVRDEENFMDRSPDGRMLFFVDVEETDEGRLESLRKSTQA